MGGRGQGKTTVLSKVTGQKLDSKHDFCGGIHISTWKFQNRSKGRQASLPEYEVSCWEFVGHPKYALAHQCFLTSHVIYMVVYRLTRQFSEIDQVKTSLLNIEAHSRHSTVMVIGTHRDKVDKQYADQVHIHLSDLIGKPGFPRHAEILEVDATDSSDVAGLQNHVKAIIVSAKDESDQSLLGQFIPHNYMDLKSLVKEEAEKIRKSYPTAAFPVIMQPKFDNLLKESEIEVEQRVQAAQFLHENGVLVHFEDPISHLNELYILEPGWLCNMVAILRMLKKQHTEKSLRTGVVHHQALYDLFPEKVCPSENFAQLLRIFNRFHILLPFDEDHFLVPSFLSKTKPKIDLPVRAVVHRKYCMFYIPSAFWSHMIARIVLFKEDIIQNAMSGAKSHPLADMDYWNKGVVALWNEDAYVIVEEQDENVVNICVPATSYGTGLLVSIVNHIDSLIEEWYPGLAGIDIHGDPLVRRVAPCSHCKKTEIHEFDLLELIKISTQTNSVECPVHRGSVLLLELAPDIVFGDIEESMVIQGFEYDDSPKYQLGDGAFGCVFRSILRPSNKKVAVKVFKMSGDTAGSENPHQQLRQEVMVLRLQHPSIVKLEALSLKPRHMLLLELAPHGTLRGYMSKSCRPSLQLQHRIASQVAEGIAFLHQKRIMYRDLKSDNVLLFSTNPTSMMNAKLADFGIACFATPSGVFDPKGTPGHRAPEVIRHQPYNLSVDIYSLGLFFFELATNGHKLFSDVASQPTAIDRLIDQKSDSIPGSSATDITRFRSTAWPDMQDLIDCCLQPNAEQRPKADQVVARLNKTEFLCLKRVVQVATEMNVETMAVRKTKHSQEEREKLEVWMGCGEGQLGHVCKVSLSDCSSQAAGFVVHGKSRVYAMLAIGESLILTGTASGQLWIYDVNMNVPSNGHEVRLPDAVLCLMHFKDPSHHSQVAGDDYVLAGLGNGLIARFDTNSLYCKTDAPTSYFRLGLQPICSMFYAKKKFWFSHGPEIVVYRHTSLKKEETRWTASSNDSTGLLTNISHVVLSSKHVWTATKHSPILRQWDADVVDTEKPKIRGEINCSDTLRSQDKTLTCGAKSVDQFRVTSLLLIPQNESLWVGLGSGHIMIFCPVKLTVLLILHRSTYPVRVMVAAKLEDEGKPMQLVLTGCCGFRRQEHNDDLPHQEQPSGCLLVWERDLHKQEQILENYRRKRKALLQL
jgi:leucine-rich repeat kinase 2